MRLVFNGGELADDAAVLAVALRGDPSSSARVVHLVLAHGALARSMSCPEEKATPRPAEDGLRRRLIVRPDAMVTRAQSNNNSSQKKNKEKIRKGRE